MKIIKHIFVILLSFILLISNTEIMAFAENEYSSNESDIRPVYTDEDISFGDTDIEEYEGQNETLSSLGNIQSDEGIIGSEVPVTVTEFVEKTVTADQQEQSLSGVVPQNSDMVFNEGEVTDPVKPAENEEQPAVEKEPIFKEVSSEATSEAIETLPVGDFVEEMTEKTTVTQGDNQQIRESEEDSKGHFEQSEIINGVNVSVSAENGVFGSGEKLSIAQMQNETIERIVEDELNAEQNGLQLNHTIFSIYGNEINGYATVTLHDFDFSGFQESCSSSLNGIILYRWEMNRVEAQPLNIDFENNTASFTLSNFSVFDLVTVGYQEETFVEESEGLSLPVIEYTTDFKSFESFNEQVDMMSVHEEQNASGLLAMSTPLLVSANTGDSIYEQGRYAVYSGLPVASSINIRTIDYIEVGGVSSVIVSVPSPYTVTIHEYSESSSNTFIKSTTNLTGEQSLDLSDSTKYIMLSVKKKNNSSITIDEGNNITLNFMLEETDDGNYEQGRYAVYSGLPLDSTINIRSKELIKAETLNMQMIIPSQYTVTVHQYRTAAYDGFIKSNPNLVGDVNVQLDTETEYTALSVKHRNNTSILTNEGENITYSWLETNTEETLFEQGRYAVYSGVAVASTNNIRTADFIERSGNAVQLNIPEQYTATIHQYKNASIESFIQSNTGLTGTALIVLHEDANYIHLSIKRKNNGSITVQEGVNVSLEWKDDTAQRPTAMLTIIDDDGNAKYYRDIYPLAKSKGVSIATAVPASFPGKKGSMTWQMIDECRANGMEILCHTYSHPLSTKINEMSQADFYSDYSQAIDVFSAHGISAELLVFSGSTGLYDKAQNPAHQLFKGSFLAGDNQTNKTGFDPYRIKRYRIGSDYAWDADTLKDLIDSLNETGGWMVWMMHTSDSARYTSDVPAVLGEVIDYCKDLDIQIVTAEYGFEHFNR